MKAANLTENIPETTSKILHKTKYDSYLPSDSSQVATYKKCGILGAKIGVYRNRRNITSDKARSLVQTSIKLVWTSATHLTHCHQSIPQVRWWKFSHTVRSLMLLQTRIHRLRYWLMGVILRFLLVDHRTFPVPRTLLLLTHIQHTLWKEVVPNSLEPQSSGQPQAW